MDKKDTTYSTEFLEHIRAIHNKRAKIVIDHIMQNGYITTEDLENKYGYSHPPRAARDVREAGIPLETFKVKSKDGKSIAAYKFGNISQLQANKVEGRTSPKKFKKNLYEKCKGRCAICNGVFTERYLQVDHRVPYEVGGDTSDMRSIENFMLICGSCNRTKSWNCEHCDNWKTDKNFQVCLKCYWGNPTGYNHIAKKDIRRLDLQWESDEVKHYDTVKSIALGKNIELPDFMKQIISHHIENHQSF